MSNQFKDMIVNLDFLVHTLSAYTDPEIISTQDEIITYVNHTAKLSCIIQHRNRQHVSVGDRPIEWFHREI